MTETQSRAGSEGFYRFGLFEVDGRTGELRKQGRNLKLRGRPFDILLLLLSRRGDMISREELRQQLWTADTFACRSLADVLPATFASEVLKLLRSSQ